MRFYSEFKGVLIEMGLTILKCVLILSMFTSGAVTFLHKNPLGLPSSLDILLDMFKGILKLIPPTPINQPLREAIMTIITLIERNDIGNAIKEMNRLITESIPKELQELFKPLTSQIQEIEVKYSQMNTPSSTSLHHLAVTHAPVHGNTLNIQSLLNVLLEMFRGILKLIPPTPISKPLRDAIMNIITLIERDDIGNAIKAMNRLMTESIPKGLQTSFNPLASKIQELEVKYSQMNTPSSTSLHRPGSLKSASNSMYQPFVPIITFLYSTCTLMYMYFIT